MSITEVGTSSPYLLLHNTPNNTDVPCLFKTLSNVTVSSSSPLSTHPFHINIRLVVRCHSTTLKTPGGTNSILVYTTPMSTLPFTSLQSSDYDLGGLLGLIVDQYVWSYFREGE